MNTVKVIEMREELKEELREEEKIRQKLRQEIMRSLRLVANHYLMIVNLIQHDMNVNKVQRNYL